MKSAIKSSVRQALWATAAVVAAWGAVPAVSKAAALDPDSCAKLKTEQETMEKAGLKEIVGKGPEWARTNLPAEKMSEIKRWIEVDEQLLFRCPGRHLVNLPLEPDPPPPAPPAEDKRGEAEKSEARPPAPPAEKKAAAPEKKAPVAPEKKAPPQRKAPPAKANSNADSSPDPDAKPAPKVKATAKQKSKDDAYKPPAGEGGNPFNVN